MFALMPPKPIPSDVLRLHKSAQDAMLASPSEATEDWPLMYIVSNTVMFFDTRDILTEYREGMTLNDLKALAPEKI